MSHLGVMEITRLLWKIPSAICSGIQAKLLDCGQSLRLQCSSSIHSYCGPVTHVGSVVEALRLQILYRVLHCHIKAKSEIQRTKRNVSVTLIFKVWNGLCTAKHQSRADPIAIEYLIGLLARYEPKLQPLGEEKDGP